MPKCGWNIDKDIRDNVFEYLSTFEPDVFIIDTSIELFLDNDSKTLDEVKTELSIACKNHVILTETVNTYMFQECDYAHTHSYDMGHRFVFLGYHKERYTKDTVRLMKFLTPIRRLTAVEKILSKSMKENTLQHANKNEQYDNTFSDIINVDYNTNGRVTNMRRALPRARHTAKVSFMKYLLLCCYLDTNNECDDDNINGVNEDELYGDREIEDDAEYAPPVELLRELYKKGIDINEIPQVGTDFERLSMI
ncbi:hypothetical protein EGW08_021945 [Elysia chlorotica]|uniref:Uncharacterized protein n=1 Tax=Elysia chlorotica TaxID=188477 RepID=A0A3S1H1E3_ELYCH|nr:hypothetical protein EGW08_021945 [Elysia chlorotica]